MGGGESPLSSCPPQLTLFISLYLLFFTLNLIFPTQSDDLGAGFGGLSSVYRSYISWNGRFGELARGAFGSYLAHTPLYPFINALVCSAFVYLFFVLIFARLPFTSRHDSQDIGVVCFIMLCLFIFKGFGSVFYWAAGSFNYLWAWVLIMAWCVPFRLFWGEVRAKNLDESGVDSSKSKPNSRESSAKSSVFTMLILGVIAGWGSEFGIVLVLFQLAFIAFALKMRIKLPAWYYAGVCGFIVGWLVLYLSPGHAARANIVNALNNDKSYVTIGELLAMPLAESFKRFAGTFSRDPMGFIWVATAGILAFLRFGLNVRKVAVAILAIVLIVAYAVPITKFVFLILIGVICLWAGIKCKKGVNLGANLALNQGANLGANQSVYLFVLVGLFVAYFLATAATIQTGVPSRAKLPYLLLGMAQIIIAWLLIKPYFINHARFVNVGIRIVCAFFALFVVSECATMRLKWERMVASIEAQKAMGSEVAVVSADTFRSNYRGYGDWGNPNAKSTDEWPNITYAKVFGVKKFVVVESPKRGESK